MINRKELYLFIIATIFVAQAKQEVQFIRAQKVENAQQIHDAIRSERIDEPFGLFISFDPLQSSDRNYEILDSFFKSQDAASLPIQELNMSFLPRSRKLTKIPDSIGNLKHLQVFTANNHNLASIPVGLKDTKIEQINLVGNNITTVEPWVCSKNLELILDYNPIDIASLPLCIKKESVPEPALRLKTTVTVHPEKSEYELLDVTGFGSFYSRESYTRMLNMQSIRRIDPTSHLPLLPEPIQVTDLPFYLRKVAWMNSTPREQREALSANKQRIAINKVKLSIDNLPTADPISFDAFLWPKNETEQLLVEIINNDPKFQKMNQQERKRLIESLLDVSKNEHDALINLEKLHNEYMSRRNSSKNEQ